ncbi:MAG TPA: lamin tail domain-containing protein [Polyangiaceae bacterium]|nr:lamin tail domain-containing protein [Polyangiaceae bacterium]
MTPFGPYYPLVLDAVMRHAERLTELLALRERALSHGDPGWPWLIGRAAELRCVAAVLGADWHRGRLSADVAAVELAQYVRHLHQGLAEQLGIRKPACCYIGLLAQLVVASILPAMVGACARGSVDGSFDLPAPLEASAPFLPASAVQNEFAREASVSAAHESAPDAGASAVHESAPDAGASAAHESAPDASASAARESALDATAAEEDSSLLPTQSTDAAPSYEGPETTTAVDAHDSSDTSAIDASLGETTDGAQGAPDSPAESTSSVAIAPLPQLGEVLITEVMFEPSGPVPDSEWFEVFNLTDSPKLLSGLTILDGYLDAHVIASSPPVVVPAHRYVLLARSRAAAVASGVSPACIAYEYGAGASSFTGIELAGLAGEVSLWNGNTQLADVPHGQWTPAPFAQSIELGVLQLVGSDVASNWCLAQRPWGASTDDGTPGAPNDCR